MKLSVGHYRIQFDLLSHRGFGIVRPNQDIAIHQLMLGLWWCVGISIRKRKVS